MLDYCHSGVRHPASTAGNYKTATIISDFGGEYKEKTALMYKKNTRTIFCPGTSLGFLQKFVQVVRFEAGCVFARKKAALPEGCETDCGEHMVTGSSTIYRKIWIWKGSTLRRCLGWLDCRKRAESCLLAAL